MGERYSPISCPQGTITPLSSSFLIYASIISESMMLYFLSLGILFVIGEVQNSMYCPFTQLRTSVSEVILFHSQK